MSKIIVTAALPYSYSIPHLGNFVGSVLPADVYHKYLVMGGEDAIFICGSDQHGTPIEIRAMERHQKPEDFANEMHLKIKSVFERYDCTFTYYGKTHTDQNKEVVYEIFDALQKNGYIVETHSTQAYCNIDKRFLIDRFIEGTCPFCKSDHARGDQCDNCGRLLTPSEIINPKCKICSKSDISFKGTKNLAIKLDSLEPKISEFIELNSRNNWPKAAKNKSQSYIKEGLKPRDITRNMDWGFKVPLEKFHDSVFYVWFDAVIGYIGITKEWDGRKWKSYWTHKDTKLVQFMGKDNIEFHTLMWPGILIGANLGFVLPTTIKSAEYLTSNSEKFSKSRGIGLDLEKCLGILPSDYWRFALMYVYPETSDSEFSIDLLREIVNNIMNDKVGNLIQRVLKLSIANKGLVKKIRIQNEYREAHDKIVAKYKDDFSNFRLREALHSLVELATLGNTIISERKPWESTKKASSDGEVANELSDIFGTLLAISYEIGIMIWPFCPNASENILKHFNVSDTPSLKMLSMEVSVNLEDEPKQLFTKMTDSQIAGLQK